MIRRPVFMQKCFTCEGDFQFGIGVYDGKHIERYNMTVCMGCYNGNHDGWGPAHEPKIIARLEAEGLAVPKRNDGGWLPLR